MSYRSEGFLVGIYSLHQLPRIIGTSGSVILSCFVPSRFFVPNWHICSVALDTASTIYLCMTRQDTGQVCIPFAHADSLDLLPGSLSVLQRPLPAICGRVQLLITTLTLLSVTLSAGVDRKCDSRKAAYLTFPHSSSYIGFAHREMRGGCL